MALNSTTLSNALQSVFDSMPASKEAAALAIAQAYVDYASAGQFGASSPAITNTHRDAMADTLATGMTVPGLPATIAAAFAAAVTTLWLAVPVAGPQVGATTGCPGAASLTASLSSVFSNLANTSATCAAGIATALHTATLTVSASLAPPPTPLTLL